jgi:hypothetical protein
MNLRETRVQLQAELLNGQNSIRVCKIVVELFQRTTNTLTPVAQTTASKHNMLHHSLTIMWGLSISQEVVFQNISPFIIYF